MRKLNARPLTYTSFGKSYPVNIVTGHYGNGRLALQLIGANGEHHGEPIATATVNMVETDCPQGEIFVKEWSENAGMTLFLIGAGIIEPVSTAREATGFVTAYRHHLTPAALAKLGKEKTP